VPFERQIIRHEDCPNCGASATVRIDDSGEEPPVEGVVMLTLVCPKCKIRRAHGMTSKAVLILEKKERNALRHLEEAPTERERRKIRARLADVRERLERARLGL
jgi:C4-type Zn-finger protein